MTTIEDKLTAAATFAANWPLDLADEIAWHMTCDEIEHLARLLRTHGRDTVADGWIAAHARHDTEEDAHYTAPNRKLTPAPDTETPLPGATIATPTGAIIATTTHHTLTY